MSIVSKLFGDMMPNLKETPKMFEMPPAQDQQLINLALKNSNMAAQEPAKKPTVVLDLGKKLSASRSPEKMEAIKSEIIDAVTANPDALAEIQVLAKKYAKPKTAKEAELATFFDSILNPPEAQPQFSDVSQSTIPQPFEGM
jgi:hypothetical protein